jgi:hypothetical protein
MIELNNSKPKISPATVYDELAHLATNNRLDCFDVYGDYDKDIESSILRSFEGAVALLFGKDDVRAKRERYIVIAIVSNNANLIIYNNVTSTGYLRSRR